MGCQGLSLGLRHAEVSAFPAILWLTVNIEAPPAPEPVNPHFPSAFSPRKNAANRMLSTCNPQTLILLPGSKIFLATDFRV